jgi:two-component system chemotaxis response regulator CheB
MEQMMKYAAVVIGVSAGGMQALGKIIPRLPATFPLPVIIVQHVAPNSDNYMVRHFDQISELYVKEADEKEPVEPGKVYFAPPNYHLLIEEDRTFSLSAEGRVNYSRPSIDVLFESALDAYCTSLIGVVLTGANNDGSTGLKKIKNCGGMTIVQNPATAEVAAMPEAAIKAAKPHYILELEDIAPMLVKLAEGK